MPLKKENPGTLTYWFHAHGKGPEPISERTQHSYCLPGLWSPLIWKFNYFITRSGAAFWQSTVAPCQLHQCGGPEAPDSEREAFQTLTCFWGTRLPKCVAFKDPKVNLMHRHYLTQVIPIPSSIYVYAHARRPHTRAAIHSWALWIWFPGFFRVQTGNVFIYFSRGSWRLCEIEVVFLRDISSFCWRTHKKTFPSGAMVHGVKNLVHKGTVLQVLSILFAYMYNSYIHLTVKFGLLPLPQFSKISDFTVCAHCGYFVLMYLLNSQLPPC